MLKISELKAPPSLELFSELVELLQDAVADGASVGYTEVPATREARNYWTQVLESVGRGERRLFVATDNHVCAGAIQLAPIGKQNGRHRGEVQKLLVHTQYRRRGIGTALLGALEAAALEQELSLLVLDTIEGGAADALYRRRGYRFVGTIPGFALSTKGKLEATAIFFRQLTAAPSP